MEVTKYEIKHKKAPTMKLDESALQTIGALLASTADVTMKNGEELKFKFTDLDLAGSRIIIGALNAATCNWLVANTRDLLEEYDAKLVPMVDQNIPMENIKLFLPNVGAEEPESFFARIEMWNKGVAVKHWRLLDHGLTNNGKTWIVLQVDKVSLDKLMKEGGFIQYSVFGQIKINTFGKKNERGSKRQLGEGR